LSTEKPRVKSCRKISQKQKQRIKPNQIRNQPMNAREKENVRQEETFKIAKGIYIHI
jgi:hypothetical protein